LATDKPKDGWDKLAVFLHPVGGLLTAVSVAFVGVTGTRVLEERQAVETNARLYSELMSRREEAESSLRKDMFVSIIQSFLKPEAGDIDAKVLNVELLAYNFHESLNLKPLFLDLQRRIAASKDPAREDYRRRLQRVAREISAKQLFALEGRGASFRRSIDLDALEQAGKIGLALDSESINVEGIACEVGLRVVEVDRAQQQLRVRLEVRSAEGRDQVTDARATFDVGFYDFPMIDNTRLANSLRCAVTLAAFSPASADLAVTCFPGEYAGIKDRPYYDEVIRKLHSADQPGTGAATTGR
jgi:hypothetical protein